MEIKIEGLKEAQERFKELPKDVQYGLQAATARALRSIQRTAQHSHRFITRTGLLERSIEMHLDPGWLSGSVVINDTAARYGPYVHQGTKPHEISARLKRSLRWPAGKDFAYAKHVHHPGTKPDQFLYEAAAKCEPEIRSIYAAEIAKVINK